MGGWNLRYMWYLAHEQYQWACTSTSHLMLSLCPLDAKWYPFFPVSLGFTENSYTECQPQQLAPVQFCQTGGYSQPLYPAARKPMQHLILSEWPFFSLSTPSKGQKHRPLGTAVECEPDLLLLLLISKDFSFLVKCLWNADLDSLT